MMQSSEKAMKAQVLALVSTGSFMIMLDSQVVTLALSTIRLDLGASIEQLEWTVNAYLLSFAVLLLTGAAIGDRFGRRRMFAVGLGLFVAASAACALAGNIGWLIAARAAQGAGAALVMPLAMALLSATFPREERGRASGTFAGITGMALIAGPVLGGVIAGGLAWRWIFWLNLPIGVVLIPLAIRRIPESFGADTTLDILGLVLVTLSAFGMVWGLMRGNHAGWSDREVVAALTTAALLAVAFVACEWRSREPMLPMRLFRSRAFAAGNVASFLLYGSVFGTLFFMAQFMQTVQGYGPLGAGLRLLAWTASVVVISPIAGRLVNRLGERPLIAVGLSMQAIGLAWIALIAAPELAYARLVVPLIVTGAGAAMAQPTVQSAVLGSVTPAEVGKASGAFNMLRYLGGVFGIAILVAAFGAAGSIGSPQSFSAGFAAAIEVSAAMSLVGAAAAMCMPGRSSSSARVAGPITSLSITEEGSKS